MNFMETYIKCDVCGKNLASYGCLVNEKDINQTTCDSCKKAIKDAIEQAKYLLSRE